MRRIKTHAPAYLLPLLLQLEHVLVAAFDPVTHRACYMTDVHALASSILVFNSRCSLLSQWFGISALFQEGGQCHASTQFQEASRKPLQTTSINFPSRSPVYSSAHIIYFLLLSLDCFFQADDAFSGHRSDNRCDLPIRQRGCRRRLCIASKEAKKTI